jgi:hypothetical protein
MEGRVERLDLLHQSLGQPLAGDFRNSRNVVDRLLGVELGALAAGLVEDVDQVGLHVEQPKLEHREQAHWARADDERVGLDHFGLGQHRIPLRYLCGALRIFADLGACLYGRVSSR